MQKVASVVTAGLKCVTCFRKSGGLKIQNDLIICQVHKVRFRANKNSSRLIPLQMVSWGARDQRPRSRQASLSVLYNPLGLQPSITLPSSFTEQLLPQSLHT